MKDKLIEQYVNRINYSDITSFASKYGITLKDKEIAFIYKHIKENWRTILYGNPKPILDDLKNNIEESTYYKIEDLYYHFKEKYQYYL